MISPLSFVGLEQGALFNQIKTLKQLTDFSI